MLESGAVLGVDTDGMKDERKSYIPKNSGCFGYSVQSRLLKVVEYFFPYFQG